MENTNQELLLRPENKRYVIYPVEYNDIWDKYKQAVASFWTVSVGVLNMNICQS